MPHLGTQQPSQDLGGPWILHECLRESGAPNVSGKFEAEGEVFLLMTDSLLGWIDLALTCFNRSGLPVPKDSLDIQPLPVFVLTPVCLSQRRSTKSSLVWLFLQPPSPWERRCH